MLSGSPSLRENKKEKARSGTHVINEASGKKADLVVQVGK
jgi:hypothetical protein